MILCILMISISKYYNTFIRTLLSYKTLIQDFDCNDAVNMIQSKEIAAYAIN